MPCRRVSGEIAAPLPSLGSNSNRQWPKETLLRFVQASVYCPTHRKSTLDDCNGKNAYSPLFLCSRLRLRGLAFRSTKTQCITSSAQLRRCFLELAWYTQIVVC